MDARAGQGSARPSRVSGGSGQRWAGVVGVGVGVATSVPPLARAAVGGSGGAALPAALVDVAAGYPLAGGVTPGAGLGVEAARVGVGAEVG